MTMIHWKCAKCGLININPLRDYSRNKCWCSKCGGTKKLFKKSVTEVKYTDVTDMTKEEFRKFMDDGIAQAKKEMI